MFQPNEKIGDYTLIEFLGEGQFGEVWLAEKRTRVLTTRVALKLPKARVKFEDVEKEAKVWEQAKGHPNVLPIVDADIHNGQIFIASEYSPDGSLEDWLNTHGGKAPSIYATVEMMRGILAGLEHLHKRQIIHRDLKPTNILLQGEIPRITDFGIAKFLPSGTDSNMIKGSPAYMSPEALEGERNEQTDLWSASVIFYKLLCGRLPFNGAMFELIKAIGLSEPEALNEDVPTPLKHFIIIGLKKKTNERHSTAKVMRSELQKAYQRFLQMDNDLTIIVNDAERRRRQEELERKESLETGKRKQLEEQVRKEEAERLKHLLAGQEAKVKEEAKKRKHLEEKLRNAKAEAERYKRLELEHKAKEDSEKQKLQKELANKEEAEKQRRLESQRRKEKEAADKLRQLQEQERKAREQAKVKRPVVQLEPQANARLNKHEIIRVYDLAKELKLDSKKVIEDVRREGIDVSVPSNAVPLIVAERIRAKYYPKKVMPIPIPRLIKTVKKAEPELALTSIKKLTRAKIPILQATPQPKEQPDHIINAKPLEKKLQKNMTMQQRRDHDGFVWIPAGEFMMGSENGNDDERPVHKVIISRPFEISKYQVTQAQWKLEMGSNPSHFKGATLPVEKVSWNDAQKFIKKLNAKNEGYNYRLPTEAEWEYACRAGSRSDYAGNLDEMGWYNKNSENKTHPV